MTNGWWRIKQHAPNNNGFITTEIPIIDTGPTFGPTEPHWHLETHGLIFHYLNPNGTTQREQHFPWASIVHAEYQPPTEGAP